MCVLGPLSLNYCLELYILLKATLGPGAARRSMSFGYEGFNELDYEENEKKCYFGWLLDFVIFNLFGIWATFCISCCGCSVELS